MTREEFMKKALALSNHSKEDRPESAVEEGIEDAWYLAYRAVKENRRVGFEDLYSLFHTGEAFHPLYKNYVWYVLAVLTALVNMEEEWPEDE